MMQKGEERQGEDIQRDMETQRRENKTVADRKKEERKEKEALPGSQYFRICLSLQFVCERSFGVQTKAFTLKDYYKKKQ